MRRHRPPGGFRRQSCRSLRLRRCARPVRVANDVPRIRRDVTFWGTAKAGTSRFLPPGKLSPAKVNGNAKAKLHPRGELRQVLENTLRTRPQAELPELVNVANQWLEQKRSKGGDAWPRAYGEPFVVRVLSEISGTAGEPFRKDPRAQPVRDRGTPRATAKRKPGRAKGKDPQATKPRKVDPGTKTPRVRRTAATPPRSPSSSGAVAREPVVELPATAERRKDTLVVRWAAYAPVRRVRVDLLTGTRERLRRSSVSAPTLALTLGKIEDLPAGAFVRLLATGHGGEIVADIEVPIRAPAGS